MSAIKELISGLKKGRAFANMSEIIQDVFTEISDRLDALEKHNAEQSLQANGALYARLERLEAKAHGTNDTERSCDKCCWIGFNNTFCKECVDHSNFQSKKPPQAEQGGDDIESLPPRECPACGEWIGPLWSFCRYCQAQSIIIDLRAQLKMCEAQRNGAQRLFEENLDAHIESKEQGGDDMEYACADECEKLADLRARIEQAEAKVKELTDELEKQKASAFETGELALKRGFEIERLEKANATQEHRIEELIVENAELKAYVRDTAKQYLSNEMDSDDRKHADFEDAYDVIVTGARQLKDKSEVK